MLNWTKFTFRCIECGRLARASEEALRGMLHSERGESAELDDTLRAEIASGFEVCVSCAGEPATDTEGEHVPECEGALDAHDRPACVGKNPARFWTRANAHDQWTPVVYCDECRHIATGTGFELHVVPASSINAPDPRTWAR
jgi:hypothetical protein